MSSSNKGKKSKSNRPSTKKSGVVSQNQNYEGAYANSRLVHVLLSLMGKKCQAKVRNGGIYEGIFHTFNPKMDVVLDAVHMRKMSNEQPSSTNGVDSNSVGSECPAEEELIDKMFFNCEKTVMINFEDVDFSFAEMEFNKTNGDISITQTRSHAKSGEKELEPWNGGGDVLEDESLILGSSGGTNGWCADEMFRVNEEKHGVRSDYDSTLSSYTMPLDISNTNEEKVAWANRIAQEIESGADYKQRIDMELDEGISEEDKFSAVHREGPRDTRRDSRDARDREREREHREYRDKDRGDRDPLSPQGFRGKNEAERFHVQTRQRGRGKDTWERRGQQGYTNPGMGPQRQMNQSGSVSGGRSQTPSQMDSPINQSGMGRAMHKTSAPLPPRFSNKGSGGHSGGMVTQREDDRMRQHGDSSMHHGYQQQKNRGQQRMTRTSPGSRSWNNPMMTPPSEYPHHSPTSQMHQDPAVISSSPGGSGGGPPLSRSSSSSSNAATSTPTRKHPSSSSDDQQQHAPPPQQHPGGRVQQTSPSPCVPPPTSNQVAMTRPPVMSQINTMSSPSLPGKALPSRPFGILRRHHGVCPRILKREVKKDSKVKEAKKDSSRTSVPGSANDVHTACVPKLIDIKNKASLSPAASKTDQISTQAKEISITSIGNALADSRTTVKPRIQVQQSSAAPSSTSVASRRQAVPLKFTGPIYPAGPQVFSPPAVQYVLLPAPPGLLPEGTTFIPMQSSQLEQNASWSSIVSGNVVTKQMGHGTEMQQPHIRQSHPHAAMAQHPQGPRMQTNYVRLTYTPRGETLPTMSPGQPYMQGQMMSRPPPQQQVPVSSPPQQQVQSQQMASGPRPAAKPQIAAKVPTMPPETRHERNYNAEKAPAEKQIKKVLEPSTSGSQSQVSSKNRNGSPSFADLRNFGKNFKLQSDVKNKDASQPAAATGPTSPTTGLSTQRSQATSKVPARQAANLPNVASSAQSGPHVQQYVQTVPPQQPTNYQQVYPVGVAHSDQNAMQPSAMEPAQHMQNHMKQMVHSHPMTQMHQQQMMQPQPPPQIPQQIPGAAPIIHNFAGGASLVSNHQQVQPVMKSPRTIPDATQAPLNRPQQHMPNDKNMVSQKLMMSPKQEGVGYPLHPNVHVVTGTPTQQANPSAVISVSAAPAASLMPPYPSPVTSMPAQVHQSPTFAQGMVSSSEALPTSPPTVGAPKALSVTSPTLSAGKALNPEAREFTPAKHTNVVTAPRTPTPSAQQMQLFMPSTPTNQYPVQVASGMATQAPGQMTPVFNSMKAYSKHGQPVPGIEPITLQQIYHPQMQPVLQHFTSVPPMPGQQVTDEFASGPSPAMYSQHALPLQMQQFTTFDQAQMYGQAPQAAIMHQRSIPTTLQGHNMQQYQADQSHNTMYVTAAVPAPQGSIQSTFMPQPRPQSAHTPTQMPHVTAASPANTVSQQVQPHTGHPIQGMTPTHNIQQSTAVPQMWIGQTQGQMATNNFMMVQSGHNLQHLQSTIPVNHPPPPAPQFALTQMPASSSTSVAMGNVSVPPQQKGHQGAIAAAQMITQNPRHYTGQ